MNRDEIMLWLHDRVGRHVTVSLDLARGGGTVDLLWATGRLRHWSAGTVSRGDFEGRAAEGTLDEVAAYYYIDDYGSTSLDLTGFSDVAGRLHPDPPDRLDISLAHDLTLTVRFPDFDVDGLPMGVDE